MHSVETALQGVLILKPDVLIDSRGYFFESFNKLKYAEFGIKTEFVQSMQSKSVKNTIRGLHYQVQPYGQSKLIHVLSGEILDVILDIRFGSPTFGQHIAIELNEFNKNHVWIPLGFAHGFSVISEFAEVVYMVSSIYSKIDERGILFNDPELNISWNINNPIVSDKDLHNTLFHEIGRDYVYKN